NSPKAPVAPSPCGWRRLVTPDGEGGTKNRAAVMARCEEQVACHGPALRRRGQCQGFGPAAARSGRANSAVAGGVFWDYLPVKAPSGRRKRTARDAVRTALAEGGARLTRRGRSSRAA